MFSAKVSLLPFRNALRTILRHPAIILCHDKLLVDDFAYDIMMASQDQTFFERVAKESVVNEKDLRLLIKATNYEPRENGGSQMKIGEEKEDIYLS